MQTIKTEIGGNPYEFSLNTKMAEVMPISGFDCFWSIGMQFTELNEEGSPFPEEKEQVVALNNMLISMIRLSGEIAVVGIAIYEGVQELMFYSSLADAEEIGAGINAFKENADEDFKSRFMGAQAVEDTHWEKVAGYFEMWEDAKLQREGSQAPQ